MVADDGVQTIEDKMESESCHEILSLGGPNVQSALSICLSESQIPMGR